MRKTVIQRILCCLAALMLTAVLFNTLPVRAGAADSIACAVRGASRLAQKGFRIRTDSTSSLRENYYRDYTVTLYRGNSYVIFGCGDANARDIDIHIYDENGNLIDRDRFQNSRPVVEVTPKWSGPFTVRVKMDDSLLGGRAYYTIAVLYR